jgi:hypothetical protein
VLPELDAEAAAELNALASRAVRAMLASERVALAALRANAPSAAAPGCLLTAVRTNNSPGASAAAIPVKGGSGVQRIGIASSGIAAMVSASPTSASTASPRWRT